MRHRVASLGFIAALITSSLTAGAQPTAPPAPSPPSAGPEDSKAEAMKKFEDGSKAFAEKRYKDAIDLFLDADRVVPNADLAFNTSLAYEAMGDSENSLRWAREYLRRAPNADDRAAVEARVASFEKKLKAKGVQQITVASKPEGATVVVDGRAVGVTPWTGELRPGKHAIVVRSIGYQDLQTDYELGADHAADLAVTLVPTPKAEPLPPPPVVPPVKEDEKGVSPAMKTGLIGSGIAALALGVGGVGAGIGLELIRASAEEDARLAPVQTDAESLLETMESYQLGARVAVGVGAGLIAAGGALLGVGLSLLAAPKTQTETSLVVTPRGLEVRGSF